MIVQQCKLESPQREKITFTHGILQLFIVSLTIKVKVKKIKVKKIQWKEAFYYTY